ncbi:MAG TPA: hypothetical protein VM327_02820 [Candidatus Thermoplasmatota archaeon]|nr:hypothetical protein [Candidatus Thermoplasmatota archaeon]
MSTTRTTTKWTLGLLALVSLASIGVASAHGGSFGGPLWGFGPRSSVDGNETASLCSDDITVGECRAIRGDPCNDDMTVADCKAAWEAKRSAFQAERRAECVERTGNETLCSEMPGHFGRGGPRGHGPGGHGPRGPPPHHEVEDSDS